MVRMCARCRKELKGGFVVHCNIGIAAIYYHPRCYKMMQKIFGVRIYPVQQ